MLVSEGPQIGPVTRLKTGSEVPCAVPGFSVASGLDCLRANSCLSVFPPTCLFLSGAPPSSQAPRPKTEHLSWCPVIKN